jgi:HK97 family phage prohead protease
MKPSRHCYRAVEFRTETTGDGRTLEGYAAVFDSPTRIDSWEGRFDESLARGAFAKSISERTPVLQFDHGMDPRTGTVPIGKIDALAEDSKGLHVRATLHDNDTVKPIQQAIASGAIDGMSFRFKIAREKWDERPKVPVRTIQEVELYELGPVVFPAYDSTSVGVRSILTNLGADERKALIRELAASFGVATDLSDAAPLGTSDSPDAAPQEGTSDHTKKRQAALAARFALIRGEL